MGFVGLSIDFDTEALYWISSGNSTINRCKLDGSGLEMLEGAKGKLTKATALAIMGGCPKKIVLVLTRLCVPEVCAGRFILHLLGNKLWWADQGTDQIGTCDKKDGSNWKVLRNSTSPMMHMKIYNETVQKGATACFGCHAETVYVCPQLLQSLGFLFCLCFLCSQAPISAVTTMETVPSCASPPPRPPGPACARQDTVCAQGSSLARVRDL